LLFYDEKNRTNLREGEESGHAEAKASAKKEEISYEAGYSRQNPRSSPQ